MATRTRRTVVGLALTAFALTIPDVSLAHVKSFPTQVTVDLNIDGGVVVKVTSPEPDCEGRGRTVRLFRNSQGEIKARGRKLTGGQGKVTFERKDGEPFTADRYFVEVAKEPLPATYPHVHECAFGEVRFRITLFGIKVIGFGQD